MTNYERTQNNFGTNDINTNSTIQRQTHYNDGDDDDDDNKNNNNNNNNNNNCKMSLIFVTQRSSCQLQRQP
jgi:hypothetical protein